MQRWHFMQYEIIPDLGDEISVLTPKLEKVTHTLEWVLFLVFFSLISDDILNASWCG